MKFPSGEYFTAIALPVFSLRTKDSCGIGEFPDLIPFANWLKSAGLDGAQILPVQSTGENPSPYSSDSAFALNPVYIRPSMVAGAKNFLTEINEFVSRENSAKRLNYSRVYAFKENIFRKIFESRGEEVFNDLNLAAWVKQNPQLKIFAVYRSLRDLYKDHWKNWPVQNPDSEFIEKFIEANNPQVLYYLWLQYEAHQQLKRAALYFESQNLFLKGDIPILMDEQSADVWYYRKYFDLNYRAGAPPDMFSEHGQNWGFPVYNWQAIENDEYVWWRDRIQTASLYYHAIRLDHVIGFMRIWTVPERAESAQQGFFSPSAKITRHHLSKAGFDKEEIAKLINEPDCFLVLGKDHLKPLWFYYESKLLLSFSPEKQEALHRLVHEYYKESELLWEKRGTKILKTFLGFSDALFCAEDLGVVPDCTASMLEKLGILSLRVARWTRNYKAESAPYIPGAEYPYLSVCTTSVHDSSTLRDWYQNEPEESGAFCRTIFENEENYAQKPHEELFYEILLWHIRTNSKICILPFQDLMAIISQSGDAKEERINIPGITSDENWSYRLPVNIEDLDETFSKKIARLCSFRKS